MMSYEGAHMPKVSVLTPVYRTDEAHLRTAIESILSQSFEDFEFILLDDCPDDPRRAIIESYKDPRIVYVVNEKNMGISPSRNRLVELAKGEYLAIFDHDDISQPQRLERQVEFLDAHPDYGVVGCQGLAIPRNEPLPFPVEHEQIKYALMEICAIPHTAAMVRKSVLVENSIRYEAVFSPAEDYALWSRMLGVTKMHNLPETLYHYREHENSTTSRQMNRMIAADAAVKALNRQLYPVEFAVISAKIDYYRQTRVRTYIKLFNFIPFLYFKRKSNYTWVYLFFVIPLWRYKTFYNKQYWQDWL
ncbi:glycosyltransferase family A protein [Anaerobiospirillum sp. NML120449]|uniref:glycosyltransferase family 2 protein n=1 Tax=Anaerobiospirillum sp. NML120449 TaxID=2932817 RepID=UPI001FF6DF9E|nr:glycosyltransferase family A protein [Anaerobiospirillum sp. NML120449]MCK0527102.1 glycosyltransferase family 2 protein [Anaerobiospirillum sp. NML120449]